jgi:predicted ATPase/DNA-binding winged helix-turn-helix (wHTH) protein
MSGEPPDVLEFGPYRVDRDQRLLLRGSEVIPLTPKVFDTLLVLVESGGRIVEKESLLKKIWPDAFVEEGSLARNVSTLRKAIGEGPHDQRYIVTVPKRGYRFVPKVSAGASAPAPAIAAPEPTTSGRAAQYRSGLFVGREREISRLEERFERLLSGAGGIVFLTGEAGIGKSSLAGEFLSLVRRMHPKLLVATGRAVEQYGTAEAYLPFLDALAALVREGEDWLRSALRTHAPTWCLQLSAFNSTGDLDQLRRETAGATKERMLREMGDALGALSSVAPLLLLLEDLHWADPATIDLLRHLCHRVTAQRVLLLVTCRPEDLQIHNHPLKNCWIDMQARGLADEVALAVLSEVDVARLLDLRFHPNDFPAELAGVIWKRTDGQPLFTVSLLEFLAPGGDVAHTGSRWTLAKPLGKLDLEIPDSVRSMIRKKGEALDEASRIALQYASVEGEEFLSTVLASQLECDELKLEEQLAILAKTHRLIEVRGEEELPDGVSATRYAFAHALYQNVFYDELVNKRRALLHRRAGEELLRHYGEQAPRIAVPLAMHFERGRDWARAIEFLLLAGTNARRANANTQAEEHYTRALALAEKLLPETRAETEFPIYERRAAVRLSMSRFDASIADCREMIDRARTIGSLTHECAALYTLGNTLFWAHRLSEMQSVLEEVLRLAERTHSQAARLHAMALMAQGHLALGELREAESKFQSVSERASEVDSSTLLGVLDVRARLHFFQSEYRTAESLFGRVLDLASELGNAFESLKAQFFLGITLANLGRISEALELLSRLMETARRNGDSFWSARALNSFGWIHRELQDLDCARGFDEEGAKTARRDAVGEAEVNSVINLALDHLRRGERSLSSAALNTAEAIASRDNWFFYWRFEIRYLAAWAEQTLSRTDALRLLEKATCYGARKYIVTARTLLAKAGLAEGDLSAAMGELDAAAAILHEFPAPLEAWKAYNLMGRVKSRLGDEAGARGAFAEAASVIRYVADHTTDDRLRRIFLASDAVQEALSATAASAI